MSDSDYWFNRGFEAGKESLRQQLTAAQEREQTNDTLLEQQGDKLAALNDLVAELRQQLADMSNIVSLAKMGPIQTNCPIKEPGSHVWLNFGRTREEALMRILSELGIR